jgi:ubiquinone biosynthesis protein
MRDNRGPEARLRQGAEIAVDFIDRLPRLIRNIDTLVAEISRDGIILHADTIAAHAAEQAKRAYLAVIPLWIAAAALVAIALALFFGR